MSGGRYQRSTVLSPQTPPKTDSHAAGAGGCRVRGAMGKENGRLNFLSSDLEELSLDELRVMAENPRFQAVDVTDVRGAHEMGGMKGHGYWYANEVISTDVTLSLRYPIPPQQRCLRAQAGSRVWRMPDDYAPCVATRLLEAYPALKR